MSRSLDNNDQWVDGIEIIDLKVTNLNSFAWYCHALIFWCSEISLAKPFQNLPTLPVQLSRHCRHLQMLELASYWRIDNATVWMSLWVHSIHARVKLLMETNPIFGICLYAMSDSILQQMWRLNAQIFKALALSVNLIIPPVLCPNLIKLD